MKLIIILTLNIIPIMRKKLTQFVLMVLMLLTPRVSYGQTVASINDKPSIVGAMWSYVAFERLNTTDEEGEHQVGQKHSFFRYTVLDEPVLLNDKTYYTLVRYVNECTLSETNSKYRIRQEGNKIYILKADLPYYDSSEGVNLQTYGDDYLLYDFSLNIGDVFCTYTDYVGENGELITIPIKVSDVTETIIDGKSYRTLHIGNNVWIEGIGCTKDFLLPYDPNFTGGCVSSTLNLYRNSDGVMTYKNPYPTKECKKTDFKKDDCLLNIPPFVGGTWSNVHYEMQGDKEKYNFYRYTVLDEPTDRNGITYYPLVRYAGDCDDCPSVVSQRFLIRRKCDKWYILKDDYLQHSDANHLPTEGDDILLYDFSLSAGDVFGSSLTVEKVSSIVIDGTIRKRLQFTNGDIWYEGLGNIRDLLSPFTAITENRCGNMLNLYRDDEGSIVYTNPFKYSDSTTDFKTDDNLLAKPTIVGATWSYVSFSKESTTDENGEYQSGQQHSFFRYTVLDEPTLLNGKTYYTLVSYANDCVPSETASKYRIRQEGNKIYVLKDDLPYYDSGEGVNLQVHGDDYLLYDFSLNVGDVFCTVTDYWGGNELTTTSVKVTDVTETIIDGQSYRTLNVDGAIWIEDIGSISSDFLSPYYYLAPTCCCGTALNLYCNNDGVITYKNPYPTKECKKTDFKKDDCLLNIPSFVGGTWSNVHYETQGDKEMYNFYRYTVLDEPTDRNGITYYPLVKYAGDCDDCPSVVSQRFLIRRKCDRWYILKDDYLQHSDADHLPTEGEDILLYDFSLSAGDVFGSSLTVEKVSNIVIDGTIRKRLQFTNGDIWYEGLGNIRDLLSPFTAFVEGRSGNMLNLYRDDEGSIVYTNPFKYSDVTTDFKTDDCLWIDPDRVSVSTTPLVIYEVDGSQICFNVPDAIEVLLYELDGKKVAQQAVVNGEAMLTISKAPAVYLYIVTYQNERRASGKLTVR